MGSKLLAFKSFDTKLEDKLFIRLFARPNRFEELLAMPFAETAV